MKIMIVSIFIIILIVASSEAYHYDDYEEVGPPLYYPGERSNRKTQYNGGQGGHRNEDRSGGYRGKLKFYGGCPSCGVGG